MSNLKVTDFKWHGGGGTPGTFSSATVPVTNISDFGAFTTAAWTNTVAQPDFFQPLTDMIQEWRGECGECGHVTDYLDKYYGGCGIVVGVNPPPPSE